jgi:hypothetical protein
VPEFLDAIGRTPRFGESLLVRGIERALRREIYDAGDLLFRWTSADGGIAETIHICKPDGKRIEALYNYPVFAFDCASAPCGNEQRTRALLDLLETCASIEGNDALRFSIMEACALALSRALGAGRKYEKALAAVDLGLAVEPYSIHLKAAKQALLLKLIAPRMEKFIGDVAKLRCAEHLETMMHSILPGGRLFFLHIPKTAGISLRHLLQEQYPDAPTFFPSAPHEDELFRMPRAEREALAVIGGHYRFGAHTWFETPTRYLTFLREPFERVVSHFHYILREPHHSLHVRAVASGLTLEQWVQLPAWGSQDNLQVRYLNAMPKSEPPFGEVTRQMLEQAKHNLAEHVEFLGLTERYAESVTRFGTALGWHAPALQRFNVTPERPGVEDLSDSSRRVIAAANELDIELYAFAKKLFERRDIVATHIFGARKMTISP